jgi:ribose transport system permease protein
VTNTTHQASAPPRPVMEKLRSLGIVGVLIVLVASISIVQPTFLQYGNLANVLSQWSPVMLMGIGMTYVMITGGFDLSVGATYSLAAVVAAYLGQTQPPGLAFAVAILVGLLTGAVNGVVVSILGVNPFIATLGSSLVISGATLVFTNNAAFVVQYPPFGALGNGRLLGLPYAGLLALGLMAVAGLALAYTTYGQSVYAVGGNAEASRLAGIRTRGVVTSTYALSGLCAGVGGVITASQLSSAQANLSPNLVFDVLTVVIVGGTSLAGGSGAIWRTAVGVAILASLQNGFNLLDVNAYYQNIVKGLIIIGAVSRIDVSALRSSVGRSIHRPVAHTVPRAELAVPTPAAAVTSATTLKEK